MNVKRFLSITMVAGLLSITAPAISSPVPGVDNGPGKEVPTTVQPLLQRLHDIKEMDKSNLSRTEKKDLRKEVKNIREQLKKASNGIYLSVGAIIIIVLLLILLL